MENNEQLDAMLDAYAKSQAPRFAPKEPANVFDANNYFTIYDLADNELTKQKDIRILPSATGGSPISEVYIHDTVVDGKKAKFPCLKHLKDEACPFCETKDLLLATGTQADKDLSKKYRARKYHIIKLIDRAHPEHGPKFWRFPDAFDKKGPYDMIMGIVSGLKKNRAIMDPNDGRDLTLMIGRSDKKVPVVSSIVYDDAGALSENAEEQAKWLADDRTWEKVFSVKNYEYLEIVVKGGVPVWDKELKQFVDKNGKTEGVEIPEADTELSMGIENVKSNILAASEPATQTNPQSTTDDVEDDLPF